MGLAIGNLRRSTPFRLVLVLGVMSALVLPGGAAHAAPGEVLQQGTNIAGEPFVESGRIRINFQNLGECPPGVTSCRMEVRWSWRGSTSIQWSTGQWTTVPQGQDFARFCPNGNHRIHVEARLAWNNSATRTVEVRGQGETQVDIGGSVVSKLIPKFLRVIGYGGFTGHTLIETKTTTNGFSSHQSLGSSGGGYLQSSC